MLTHDTNCVLLPALPRMELRGAQGHNIKLIRNGF